MNIFNFKSDKTVIVYEMLRSALGLAETKPFVVSRAVVPAKLPAAGGFGGSNACAAQVFIGPATRTPQN